MEIIMDIEDLINQITDDELNNANKSFNDIMNDRINMAMEAEKVKLADTIFNDENQLELELEEEDYEDEDEDLEDYDEEEIEEDEDN